MAQEPKFSKVTVQAAEAFIAAESFKQGNTQVEVQPDVTILKLHGNDIAFRYNDEHQTLKITTAGWDTQTTRERLNGILFQLKMPKLVKKKTLLVAVEPWMGYKVWDGKLIEINYLNK